MNTMVIKIIFALLHCIPLDLQAKKYFMHGNQAKYRGNNSDYSVRLYRVFTEGSKQTPLGYRNDETHVFTNVANIDHKQSIEMAQVS